MMGSSVTLVTLVTLVKNACISLSPWFNVLI